MMRKDDEEVVAQKIREILASTARVMAEHTRPVMQVSSHGGANNSEKKLMSGGSELKEAIDAGDWKLCKELIESGRVDVHKIDYSIPTALTYAIETKEAEFVKKFLRDSDMRIIRFIKLFINRGTPHAIFALFNRSSDYKKNDLLAILGLLRKRNASGSVTDSQGYSVLMRAIPLGYDVVNRVIRWTDVDAKYTIPGTNISAISLADQPGIPTEIYEIIASGPANSLSELCRLVDEDGIITRLMEKPNEAREGAPLAHLMRGLFLYNYQNELTMKMKFVIEFLVQKGADINARHPTIDMTPLCIATRDIQDPNLVIILLQNGANIGIPCSSKAPETARDYAVGAIRQILTNFGEKDVSPRSLLERQHIFNDFYVEFYFSF
jgi:hypothetical protein